MMNAGLHNKGLVLFFSLSLLTLFACSSSDTDVLPDSDETGPDSSLTDDFEVSIIDTAAIAGLWDGSSTINDTTDEVFWNLSVNGLLTRFDFQQDGASGATGENCYLIDEPLVVIPRGGDEYSILDVPITITSGDGALNLVFLEADSNDLDANGDRTEVPAFTWASISNLAVIDLNGCEGEVPPPRNEPLESELPVNELPVREIISQAQCQSQGGSIVGDIGNGAIFTPEFRCPSGQPPIANIGFSDGEPTPVEGAVCCV